MTGLGRRARTQDQLFDSPVCPAATVRMTFPYVLGCCLGSLIFGCVTKVVRSPGKSQEESC